MNNTVLCVNDVCNILKDLASKESQMLIFCHQNPDGDTVGSAFALKMIYEALGGKAKCVCCGEAAQYLRFLYCGQDTVEASEAEIEDNVCLCAVDVASPQQLGSFSHLSRKFSFMIDHHGVGDPFAPCLKDPTAAACGELIFEIYDGLVKNNTIRPNAEIARRIYAAISADTGSFKYSNTTNKSHVIAAHLTKEIGDDVSGMSCADIAHRLHDSKSIGELKAQKAAIENLRFLCNSKLVYTFLTEEIMKNEGISEADTGSVVDICRNIEGVSVGVVLKQPVGSNKIKISSRSNGNVDVASVCAVFGGGGHAKAAGGTVEIKENISRDEAAKAIISKFEEAVKQSEKGQI